MGSRGHTQGVGGLQGRGLMQIGLWPMLGLVAFWSADRPLADVGEHSAVRELRFLEVSNYEFWSR